MSEQKSQERLQLEQRLVKCGYNHQDFSNLGRNALKKKVHELETVPKETISVENKEVSDSDENKEDVSEAEDKKRLKRKKHKARQREQALKDKDENKELQDENEVLKDEVKELKDKNKALKDKVKELEALKDENISLFYENKQFIAKTGDVFALKDDIKLLKHIICYGASKEELNKRLELLRNEYQEIYTTRLLTEPRKVVKPCLDALHLKIMETVRQIEKIAEESDVKQYMKVDGEDFSKIEDIKCQRDDFVEVEQSVNVDEKKSDGSEIKYQREQLDQERKQLMEWKEERKKWQENDQEFASKQRANWKGL